MKNNTEVFYENINEEQLKDEIDKLYNDLLSKFSKSDQINELLFKEIEKNTTELLGLIVNLTESSNLYKDLEHYSKKYKDIVTGNPSYTVALKRQIEFMKLVDFKKLYNELLTNIDQINTQLELLYKEFFVPFLKGPQKNIFKKYVNPAIYNKDFFNSTVFFDKNTVVEAMQNSNKTINEYLMAIYNYAQNKKDVKKIGIGGFLIGIPFANTIAKTLFSKKVDELEKPEITMNDGFTYFYNTVNSYFGTNLMFRVILLVTTFFAAPFILVGQELESINKTVTGIDIENGVISIV